MTEESATKETGWTGWIAFAVVVLLLQGMFGLIIGFVALFQEDVYAATERSIWVLDMSSWGWVHILSGLFAVIAGASLAKGYMFGRVIAVIVAMIAAIVNMAFVPIYPLWSLMMVAIAFFVIWAVIVHGKEVNAGNPIL
jgi:hypothetical protein